MDWLVSCCSAYRLPSRETLDQMYCELGFVWKRLSLGVSVVRPCWAVPLTFIVHTSCWITSVLTLRSVTSMSIVVGEMTRISSTQIEAGGWEMLCDVPP